MTTHYLKTTCPHCGRLNNGHTAAFSHHTAPPDAESWSVCWGCVKPFGYTAELRTRALSDDELAEIKALPIYSRIVEAMLESPTPREMRDLLYGTEGGHDDD